MAEQKGWALVTGASRGIGREFARILAVQGYGVAISARDPGRLETLAEELKEAAGERVRIFVNDLSAPDGPQNLYRDVCQAGLEIEILVNNAGFGGSGPFAKTDLGRERDMIAVNVTAPTALCKLFLEGMAERGSGGILNVASSAAFQAGPYAAVYFATKAYLLHFSEALSVELDGSGVSVTCLCPGATETGFFDADWENNLLKRKGKLNPQKVARTGLRALKAGKPVVVTGFLDRMMAFSVRFAPRKLVAQITSVLTRPSGK